MKKFSDLLFGIASSAIFWSTGYLEYYAILVSTLYIIEHLRYLENTWRGQ